MKVILTQAIVRELLYYNPNNGRVIWRWRDKKWFSNERSQRIWNKRFAGRPGFARKAKKGQPRLAGIMLGGEYYTHRIIWLYMTGSWPVNEIDHENQDACDNRWDNLQDKTHAQNHKNKPMRRDNTTGVTGVIRGARGKFIAQLKGAGRPGSGYLGQYATIEEAAKVRKAAEKRMGYSAKHGRPRHLIGT